MKPPTINVIKEELKRVSNFDDTQEITKNLNELAQRIQMQDGDGHYYLKEAIVSMNCMYEMLRDIQLKVNQLETSDKPSNNQRLIKLEEVMHRTGLSNSTIYLLIKDDKFPKQIKISERASAWLESEVNEWINEKISERGQ